MGRAERTCRAPRAPEQGQLAAGLTKREIDKQSIIQMTGLCAELRKYGQVHAPPSKDHGDLTS